eukprot:TRINITY_DN1758_c0_g1_i2.p1 TRINITY_DN1758_c0_g1~~TRINITY_DN1758_c0_g1_i2.p1  ORF type:complete len:352 (-),score=41.85 TRINITY_DN1758_c0_g1_i2:44-1099(-)
MTTMAGLTHLHLGLNLINTIPPMLASTLLNLQELRVEGNNLTSIPPLDKLVHLELLSVGFNRLPDLPALPPSLTTLIAPANHFGRVPATVLTLPALRHLDLSENGLTFLPADLSSMKSLVQLFLHCNRISELPAGFGSVGTFPLLRRVDLMYNDFAVFPTQLLALPALADLSFQGNPACAASFDEATVPPVLGQTLTQHVAWGYPRPDEIVPGLYLGDVECARNRHALLQLGVDHILTIAFYRPVWPNDFTYMVVEVDDREEVDLSPHFQGTTDFIANSLHSGGRVLVHCHAGVSRSATVVVAYLIAAHGWTAEEAQAFVKARRPRILPKHNFVSQLAVWREHCTASAAAR